MVAPTSPKIALVTVLLALVSYHDAGGQALRDGKRFDPGATMAARAEGAPEELDQMRGYLGQWDVSVTTYPTDSTSFVARGLAEVTFMNRGHGMMERLHVADFDGEGHELNTIALLTVTRADRVWALGEANSFTETISMYDGGFEDGDLVLRTAVRRGGSVQLTYYEARYHPSGPDALTFTLSTSRDHGATWQPALEKAYTRRAPSEGFMGGSDPLGKPAPGLPDEARQFDFLLGEWDAAQEITLANGQTARFPSTSTAVFALNGHGVMEYSWYDVDTNLPDAATTIVRLYNRAMRRWESLYVTNRFNNLLFFGGRQEGDRIVLTLFETDTATAPISHFIFHDIEADRYKWFAESSRDRGETFQTTWTIEMTRR
jgi:hypothetical protein